MREGNTDVRYALASMLDTVSELFNGRISLQELMDMDMPMMRSLVNARLKNLEKQRKSRNQDSDMKKLMKDLMKM